MNDEFKQFRNSQIVEMRAWEPGDDMLGVSISMEDANKGSPKSGDMIARSPDLHDFQWLVPAGLAAHYIPVSAAEGPDGPIAVAAVYYAER